MTHELKTAIDRAMSALRAVGSILDSGEPAEIGDIDEADAEALLNLSDLAGDVSVQAEQLFDSGHELVIE
jgi:hypothetical protein